MTTPDISQKLAGTSTSDENNRPISEALLDHSSLINDGQNIINANTMNDKPLPNPELSNYNEDTVNGNSSGGGAISTSVPSKDTSSMGEGNVVCNSEVAKNPESKGERNIRRKGVPSNDTNPKSVENTRSDSVVTTKDTISKGEESVRGSNSKVDITTDPASKSEGNETDNNVQVNIKTKGTASKGTNDVTGGNVIPRALSFVSHDVELPKKPNKVRLFSCNQQPGNERGFLKMVLDGYEGLKVTTTGVLDDPHALWLIHYTVDGEFRQVLILENERCTKITKKRCVLYTQRVKDTKDYILNGKIIDTIPKRLNEIEPSSGFYKVPRTIGSELLYLKSMLTTEERTLFVGFDGAGQPIPLNIVKKYSPDFQALFRVLEAG